MGGSEFTCIFAVEETVLTTLLFGVLDLEDVRVDDVADVVGVERRFVEVDDLLIKVADLAQVLFQIKQWMSTEICRNCWPEVDLRRGFCCRRS